jgi:hypothetical protein
MIVKEKQPQVSPLVENLALESYSTVQIKCLLENGSKAELILFHLHAE